MKLSVARMLEQLGLHPIILHEKEDQGRTVIEKFIDHAGSLGAAIVLLSPDDRIEGADHNIMHRARQNVIFELGYFLGALGRDRVIALHKVDPNLEMPSDYIGVLFKRFEGDWPYEVGKELRAMGDDVDLNTL